MSKIKAIAVIIKKGIEVNSSILSENTIINIPNNVKEVGRSLDFNLLMLVKYNINPKEWAVLILIMLFKQKTATLKQYNGYIIISCSPSWARTKDPLINSQML